MRTNSILSNLGGGGLDNRYGKIEVWDFHLPDVAVRRTHSSDRTFLFYLCSSKTQNATILNIGSKEGFARVELEGPRADDLRLHRVVHTLWRAHIHRKPPQGYTEREKQLLVNVMQEFYPRTRDAANIHLKEFCKVLELVLRR